MERTRRKNDLFNLGHMPMRPGVYRIVNDRTGECYVGSSQNMNARCRGHFGTLTNGKHDQRKLVESFNKHAISDFSAEVLEEVEPEDLALAEFKWMNKLQPVFNNTFRVARKHGRLSLYEGLWIQDREIMRMIAHEASLGAGKTLIAATEVLIREACLARQSIRASSGAA